MGLEIKVPIVEMIPSTGSDIFINFAKIRVEIPVPTRDVAVRYVI